MFADVGNVPAIISKGGDGEGHGMMGASGMWIFALVIIFLALAFFGGSFGRRDERATSGIAEVAALNALGNGGANGADNRAAFTEINGRFDSLSTQIGHINDVNDLRDLKSTQAELNQNVTQQAFNLSTQIATNRTDTLLNFKDLSLQMANGFCDTARSIDGVNFNAAQNTCNIINAVNMGVQRVIDNQTANEMTRLRDELSRERLAASQFRQDLLIERNSDRVIGALTPPRPVPAYPSWAGNVPINPIAYEAFGGAYPA